MSAYTSSAFKNKKSKVLLMPGMKQSDMVIVHHDDGRVKESKQTDPTLQNKEVIISLKQEIYEMLKTEMQETEMLKAQKQMFPGLTSKMKESEPVKSYRTLFVIFKFLCFIGCFGGFAYQAIKFLNFYWTYPTIINMKVEKPRDFILPAVTFCDANPIARSKYCQRFPSRCEYAVKENGTCKEFPHYCTGEDDELFLIPMKKYFHAFHEIHLKDLNDSIQDLSSFFHRRRDVQDMDGPFYYREFRTYEWLVCYTLNSRVDNDKDPGKGIFVKLNEAYFNDGEIENLRFTLDPNHLINPDRESGVFLHIHSPFKAANPFDDAILLKPEKEYKIHLQLEEERRLQDPYVSDCANYTEIWERNKRMGPRSQQMCIEHCKMEFDLESFGCVMPWNLYPTSQQCEISNNTGCINAKAILLDKYSVCTDSCKVECVKLVYRYTVQEGNTKRLERHDDLGYSKIIIKARILINNPEIRVQEHKRQYQDVELFSYIGGFLGCWLGMSIFAFPSIIKHFFRYIKYWYRQQIDSKKVRKFVIV